MENKKSKSKYGFTLAEVLISITLIGVLGAILIPVITKSKPNTNKIMFKKEYKIIEETVSALINDDTIYPATKNGFNYQTDPTALSGTVNKFCYFFLNKLNTIGSESCPATSVTTTPSTPFATTTDGAVWYIYPNTTALRFLVTDDTYYVKIIIDVNGATKAPNCSADSLTTYLPSGYTSASGSATKCPNPDTFIIGIAYNGKINAGTSNPTSPTTITDQTAIDYLADPLNNK